jgi:SAM-dependent methyltransferase
LNRIEQHMAFLDERILTNQVLGNTYQLRTRQNLKVMLEAGYVKRGERVLEIGTGDGLMLGLLAENEIAATGVCKSRSDFEACKQKGYDIHFADMSDLPFDDQTFDFIYTRNAFDHSLMPAITLSEFRRVVKPGRKMWIEFEWFSPEDVQAHPEVRRVGDVYKDGGSFNKHRHWCAMTWEQMRWLLLRLDFELIDSFFANESQAFIFENSPYRGGGADHLDQWGRIKGVGVAKKSKGSILKRLFRGDRNGTLRAS